MNDQKRNIKSIGLLLRNNFSILKTLYFNFHYFTFTNAIKFPVFIYRGVRFRKTRGRVTLGSLPVKTGMIHIGRKSYGFQQRHDHTIWEQHGGTIILNTDLNTEITIGKGTFLSVGNDAILTFEKNIHFGGNDKIICRKSITIKENTIVAWDVQIIDTDFRATINTITDTKNCYKKEIIIGRNNWLCFGCTVLKGSITPDNCIVGAKSVINKDFSNEGENIVIGMENDAKVLARHISFDFLGETED